MSDVDVTHTCIQVMSPIFESTSTSASERREIVVLANSILALIDVFFFNTDDKKPYEASNTHAVSLEGALIWELPSKEILQIRCAHVSDRGVRYEAFLYASHGAWCDALEKWIFPEPEVLPDNIAVINYLMPWYPEM